jgi:uncharacterized protein YndB with AHSA1/START domain
MKVHESIEIAAPPQLVWAYLADPHRMADWHEKLETVHRADVGQVYGGERFGTTYVMGANKQRRQDAEAEVLRCEPWTTFALRHHFVNKGQARHVDETFELWPIDDGNGTRVEQMVDFAGSGLPLWARLLMSCISRTGKPSGPGILEPLKRVCEEDQATTPRH